MPNDLIISVKPISLNELERIVLGRFAESLNKTFRNSVDAIRDAISDVVRDAIKAGDEYQSLLGGTLRHELGVVNAEPVLDAAIESVLSGMQVEPSPVTLAGNKISGHIDIGIIKTDYSEILGIEGGVFTSKKGHEVPWLKWLTLAGTEIVVADYHYESGGKTAYASRTGDGLMFNTGKWSVPSDSAGTEDDNWLTRAILKSLPEIEEAIMAVITGTK